MGFIAAIISVAVIITIIIIVVEIVIQIVEVIVHLIMVILGWVPDSQTIEYFEVRNYPLFGDPDRQNPILSGLVTSILQETDITTDLIYAQTFRSLKGNLRKFMQFIENGNYFEPFPDIESYIVYVDYDELTAALVTLNGVPCTPVSSSVAALDDNSWIKYWLQENKDYYVGANLLGTSFSSVTTTPIIPATTVAISTTGIIITITITDAVATEDAVAVNALAPVVTTPITPAITTYTFASTNHFGISITSEIATEDYMMADDRWTVNFNNVVYNAIPNNYTVQVYQESGVVMTLPYTVPVKPLQLHYISQYYRDSDPTREYLFVYMVGAGTYLDLDTVESPLSMDGTALQVIPDIPLRISNADYTTFGATKATQIEDLCDLIDIEAGEVLDKVLSDPDALPGDIDNIYLKFGVRLWDTSQIGMTYLFTAFENLFPAQGVSQGDYNNAAAGDAKPVNNIITTTEDSKYLFQWSYITFVHTTLTDINADSGSVENGIYYSDLSRFKANGLLSFPYYSSSGKGTYNVGFKADNLTEVAAFLAGNGIVNPGTTTTEGTNWLQVTTRLNYNNTSPVLQDPDGSTSDLLFLTGDMIYQNNGSGVLRIVESAQESTTVGQSITYYCSSYVGLDAYTVTAPTGAVKVIDGASGVFKTVRFNLGNRDDLMFPFIHTFIKDRSNKTVTQLFLAGGHVSIYIAHYEVIQPAGMSILTALLLIIVIIIVIVVVTIFTLGSGTGPVVVAINALIAGTLTTAIAYAAIIAIVQGLVIQFIIQLILTEVAKFSPELAAVLGVLAAVGMAMYGPGATGTLGAWDYAQIAVTVVSEFNRVQSHRIEDAAEELNDLTSAFDKEIEGQLEAVNSLYTEVYGGSKKFSYDGKEVLRVSMSPLDPGAYYILATDGRDPNLLYATGDYFNLQTSVDGAFI